MYQRNNEVRIVLLRTPPPYKTLIRTFFRMYPVVIGNGRQTTNDCIIGGYQIPKGVSFSEMSIRSRQILILGASDFSTLRHKQSRRIFLEE